MKSNILSNVSICILCLSTPVMALFVSKKTADPSYPVIHTKAEWDAIDYGLAVVQNEIIHSSMPSNVGFWCDSVLVHHRNDFGFQVHAAIINDTANKNKK